jgi:hypothetical protein
MFTMADLAVTAANVLASSAATIERLYNFGATVTTGQAVYLDETVTPPTWKLLDRDAAATGNELATKKGIALNGGASGQPAAVCTKDTDFTPGATLTNGSTIYSSDVAGGITSGDIPTTGDYPTVLMVAKSTTKANLNPTSSGAVI